MPKGPNDPNMLRIAMILFASNPFETCPSFQKVMIECNGITNINFNNGYNVPKHFDDLLEESKQINLSDKVCIYLAELYEQKI